MNLEEFIKIENPSHEQCLDLVKNWGWDICYIPKKLRTLEICKEALKQDTDSWDYVPKEIRKLIIINSVNNMENNLTDLKLNQILKNISYIKSLFEKEADKFFEDKEYDKQKEFNIKTQAIEELIKFLQVEII